MTESRFRPVLLCGLPAVLACFEKRPSALKRLWLSRNLNKPLGEVCKWMAQEHRAYSDADERELAYVAGHGAHGGVVAATERPLPGVPKPSDYADWQAASVPLLFLENIADPLQIGAIARVAVGMGLTRLILSGTSVEAAYHERAWSTSGGALDSLTLHDAGEVLTGVLRALRERFCIVGFTRPGGRRVDEIKPIRAPGRPLAIVLGDGETGISSGVAGKCEYLLHIPGAGGSTLLNGADAAAFGLPWLLRKDHKSKGVGFLARKRGKAIGAVGA
ncbi:MAG: hypothetical protein LBV28_02470, partial [Puniceicoccales bacterium]|nr:hypothetical protein [Puniceicoccales bacterium]